VCAKAWKVRSCVRRPLQLSAQGGSRCIKGKVEIKISFFWNSVFLLNCHNIYLILPAYGWNEYKSRFILIRESIVLVKCFLKDLGNR